MREHENDPDTWGVNLFISEIKLGDVVFIWLTKCKGRETRGIYAMAEISGKPDPKRGQFDWEQQFWVNKEAKEHHKNLIKLELRYTKPIIGKYISKDELVAAGLGNLLILRMPQATIYKVTPEDCTIIKKLVEARKGSKKN